MLVYSKKFLVTVVGANGYDPLHQYPNSFSSLLPHLKDVDICPYVSDQKFSDKSPSWPGDQMIILKLVKTHSDKVIILFIYYRQPYKGIAIHGWFCFR